MEHIIKTDRLQLKPLSESDISFIQELESRPETYEYDWDTALPYEKIENGCHWFIENTKSLPDKGAIRWILISNDAKIGEVHIDCISSENHEWEIGWHLLPEYWGRGFASEAVAAVIKYAFSVSLAERVGMLKDGRMRESKLIKGIYYDEYIYSILKHEVVMRNQSTHHEMI